MRMIGVVVASTFLALGWEVHHSLPKLLGGALGIALGVSLVSIIKIGSLTNWVLAIASCGLIAVWAAVGGSINSMSATSTSAFASSCLLMVAVFVGFPIYGYAISGRREVNPAALPA